MDKIYVDGIINNKWNSMHEEYISLWHFIIASESLCNQSIPMFPDPDLESLDIGMQSVKILGLYIFGCQNKKK